ncbi:MAG: response regulator [Nitrospira sp.]|nr:response regulator [Nitrospira sp.]
MSMFELLSQDHTILERPFMEFPPFGADERGERIQDVSGAFVSSYVQYLEDYVSQNAGSEAGEKAVRHLCHLLNERVRDPACQVTPKGLRHFWRSYSYEFFVYLREFCIQLSGDPKFVAHVAQERALSPAITLLARPFPIHEIYKMWPHFGLKYVKGCTEFRVATVTDRSAILSITFSEHALRQIEPFQKRCAALVCQNCKAGLASIPVWVHRLPPATVKDLTCMVKGDKWCEWEFTWTPQHRRGLIGTAWHFIAGGSAKSISPRDEAEATVVPTSLTATVEPHSTPDQTVAMPHSTAPHLPEIELLSKDHRILERPFMEFRPFGADEREDNICDVSGVSVRAMVSYLEWYVSRSYGSDAGSRAVEELCRLLNERIRDSIYHVTPKFIKNTWNSYSYEFVCYVYEFCEQLSGDPRFAFNSGKDKIAPVIQILGRPFPVSQIYKMFPHFGQKYTKGSIEREVCLVTDHMAILRMKFTERSYRQFGAYRNRCAQMICQSHHGSFAAVPERVHHLPPATIVDRTCIVDGAEWCEWEITWLPQSRRRFGRNAWKRLTDGPAPNGLDKPTAREEGLYRDSFVQPPIETPRRFPPAPPRATPDLPRSELLSKDHTILERGVMQFRPFGVDGRGEKISDITGMIVRASVDYLEDCSARTASPHAGTQATRELCRLLNERIPDPVYHVTPEFLKRIWNSYSYEFVCYLREFCERLSGDPEFVLNAGRRKKISPIFQVLGQPFSVAEIYKMYSHFAQQCASRKVVELCVDEVTEGLAIMRLTLTEQAYREFGPYRKRCAELACKSAKGGLSCIPEIIHHLPPAVIKDRACIVNGDAWCEWEIAWPPQSRRGLVRNTWERLMRKPAPIISDESATQEGGQHRQSFGIAPLDDTPQDARPTPQPEGRALLQSQLLSQDHTILEKGEMEFRPFGVNPDGTKVNDATGIKIRAYVDYLEEVMSRRNGPEAGEQASHELCRLLNDRIADPVYHVTPKFLKNVWNSYSYEFVCFLGEFCKQLSGDPLFSAHVGEEKFISSVIQTLGRPFSVAQIFRQFPHFGEKFSSLVLGVGGVTDRSAILTMTYPDSVYRQFGPFRKACAALICQSAKGGLRAVPEKIHRLKRATIRDRKCVATGDDRCEWELTWEPRERISLLWQSALLLSFGAGLFYLYHNPAPNLLDVLVFALPIALAGWLGYRLRMLQHRMNAREELIQEQLQTVDARHEELREAYLEQEQTAVELRRKVNQLTTLHRAGLLFSATLDRETLLQNVLETLIHDLRYDRAMIAFFDRSRKVSYDARILGVSEDIAALVRSREVPITTPNRPEGTVLLEGRPILIGDLREVWDQIHPLNQELARLTQAKSIISVPLKAQDQVLGSLTVDRSQANSLTQDDLDLMVTVASQVAIALDNAQAYRQIEELNIGLETKVLERTAELQKADQLRSLFLSHVSHELRTPLTSIKGFVDNFMSGLAGPLVEKQQYYLSRIGINADRLIRMITDLLDQSRIQAGKIELLPVEVELKKCIGEVMEQLRPLAAAKQQRLEVYEPETPLLVWADVDRLIQILMNLIHNAIKYTPDHGLIWVRAWPHEANLAGISVSDSGPGISPEVLDKIFDPFFRISQGRRGGQMGLGLGLSIAKTLVNLHGGTISARSEPGKGTEFHFTVPLLPHSRQIATRSGSKRILVVDDDPDIRQLLLDRLGSYGYSIQASADGSTALEMIGSGSFDGMLLDIGMPDIDGLDVLRRIRNHNQSLPVIVITASGSQERAVEAVSMGAQAYLLKPFDVIHLEQVVNYWFRGSA